ncbi:MAG: hypothetical protein V3S38_05985 [Acidimicrobiia bacterium]
MIPFFLVAAFVATPIRDNSFLWHVRAGTIQLGSLRVLTEDPFSLTLMGTSWRTQSWLIELLYAYFELWFVGLAWVNIMVMVLGSVTAALIGVSMYRSTRSPIMTGFAMVATVWLAGPFLQPRPVVASYLLLGALVVVLQNRERAAWLVVPIIWMWAGVHGSWVIGGGLVVLEWLRTSDRRLLKVGLAALATTFLTAHGVGVWEILRDFAGAQGALALIDEWNVPDFGALTQAPYLLLITGVIVAAMRGRLEPRDLIVVLPFLFFGMTSQRAVFPAAIVLAPWAALALPRLKLPRSSSSPAVVGVAMLLGSLLAVMPFIVQPLGELDYERFPSPAIQAAMEGRSVFHDDVVGGFVIFTEWPERVPVIDDRAELYGEEFFLQFTKTRSGQYEEFFAEYGFDAALTREEWGLTARLDDDGWVRVAEESGMVLFYRPIGDQS